MLERIRQFAILQNLPRLLTPWARIRDVKMVSALFGWELGARLILNEIAEDRLLSLEFSRFVAGVDPV